MNTQRISDRASLCAALAAAVSVLFAGCASTSRSGDELKTVERVELDRYMGDWYVIANIPNRAEKDCHDSIEIYELRPDGRINNRFECRDGSFDKPMERRLDTIATVFNAGTNAEWRVRIFRVIQAKYLVIDLDPAYQWAVVGHPSRAYGWVLARTKSLPDEVYSGIMGRLREQGYDVSKFARIPQKPPAS